MEKKSRNYGIDLLRLFLMFMVCVLHILTQGGVLNSVSSPLNWSIYYFIEVFCYCAVDAFALISGYVGYDKKQKRERIVYLWFEVLFYSLIITIIFMCFNLGNFITMNELIKMITPISTSQFWYMTAYFPLFFVMPYINKLIGTIDRRDANVLLTILFIIFSCFGIINDNWCNSGYSFLWLMILYIFGAIIKKNDLFHKLKSLHILLIILIIDIINWILYIFFGLESIVSYISPIVLLNATLLVVLFSRIKVNSKITTISSLSLGIYLFQNNKIVWEQILGNNIGFIGEYNIVFGMLLLFITACLLFFVGMLIDYIRKKLFNLTKIDDVCKYIVEKFNKLFNSIIELIMED